MIISASRRTDLPAFYSEWFMKRINAGYCTFVNPFNRNQVSYVSLQPEDVDAIVFWTKNPKPLMPHLKTLDEKGYKYYFQFTLNGYPEVIEGHVPDVAFSIETFQNLSMAIGKEKVIWRYDPLIFSNITDVDYHLERFNHIAGQLAQYCENVVISLVDDYRKAGNNFKRLEKDGVKIDMNVPIEEIKRLLTQMAQTARQYGLDIYTCAEEADFDEIGIKHGKCIDIDYLKKVFAADFIDYGKDKFQREECGCAVSKDIGVYDTCLHGCAYCYAGTETAAKNNRLNHDPLSPSLIGFYDAQKPEKIIQVKPKAEKPIQLELFKEE